MMMMMTRKTKSSLAVLSNRILMFLFVFIIPLKCRIQLLQLLSPTTSQSIRNRLKRVGSFPGWMVIKESFANDASASDVPHFMLLTPIFANPTSGASAIESGMMFLSNWLLPDLMYNRGCLLYRLTSCEGSCLSFPEASKGV